MRLFAPALALLLPVAALACNPSPASPPVQPVIRGIVSDPTGAIVPGAQIQLVDSSGKVDASIQSGGDGSFRLVAPDPGSYTLVVSEPGFKTVHDPVVLRATSSASAAATTSALGAPLHIILPIAAVATNIHVSAETSEDITATEDNHDSSVLTAEDLKSLPIFDNDYASAMSAFMDDSAAGTGGSGLIVDGVESDNPTVSASAVKEVLINQDPYTAEYYWPGRGQMEIITKSAEDHFHGEFNFYFRDNAMNAQNALAPSKPFEQRRIYEGHLTGPIFFLPHSSFLASFNRAEEDLNTVVNAVVEPTSSNPTGILLENVPTPNRNTDFSIRFAHQFGSSNSGYAQYSYHDWHGQNQGVGGHNLQEYGYTGHWHEDNVVLHLDSTLSPVAINQLSLVAERTWDRNVNNVEAPRVFVSGDFTGGSAQNDSYNTQYNFRLFDRVTWSHGRHLVKAGIGIPHIARRAFDDYTNELGSYTFAPTLDSSGNIIATSLQNYANNLPSAYSQDTGDTHFIFHQQEMGAFIQDEWKISDTLSITPGIRYDWQNFLATKRLGFSPRFSFAWVLNKASKAVVRGGGGIYYDRFGPWPILTLVRFETDRRRSIQVSLNPAQLPATGCVPITACTALTLQPPNFDQLAPSVKIPYQIQYGLSIERQIGEHATGVISVYSARGIDQFRSVDINAPTPASGYTVRPNPSVGRITQMQSAAFWVGNGLDISFRGRVNKYFTGFGRYSWSHYESNTGGLGWYPQNQYAPNNEWSNANWDQRQRLGLYAMINRESLFNIAAGVFANTGRPWTILTGTDAYGDNLFNTRPDGVARNSETGPTYVDLDLRWGHDFHLTQSKADESPQIGFSAGAFNLLNHPNPGYIEPIQTSSSFGKPTSFDAPRRLQMAMRLEF